MEIISPIYLSIATNLSDSVGEKVLYEPQNNQYASILCLQSKTASLTKADEDDEYEVEEIIKARAYLKAHVYYRKLQYYIKQLRYKDNPEQYNASNFKNSLYKLCNFYTANPTYLGPLKRLRRWVQYQEEDRDTDNYPNNNKPKRLHIRGGTP